MHPVILHVKYKMTFCKLPWQGIDISPQGEFKPCCKYATSIADNLDDYLSSKELKELKSAFLLGEKPSACNRCWKDELSGKDSKRQLESSTLCQESFNDTLKIVSFAFGNTCNLSCRYCKSYASSSWVSDEKELKKHRPEIKIFNHNKFYKNTETMLRLFELSKDAILIEFPGGEPFYSGIKEHIDYIKYLLNHNPEKKTLRYITNCTNFPKPELISLWKQFKSVDIQLSIDGVGNQFEYMRHPAKWEIVYANIKRYQEFQRATSNIQLSISHTVGILNVFYLDNFIRWIEQEELPVPYIGLVTKPQHFNIINLSNNLKDLIARNLLSAPAQPIKTYLLGDGQETLTRCLSDRIREVDQLRDQSYKEYFPEFASILNM